MALVAGLMLLAFAASVAEAQVGQPVNRWSIDGMRANRIERPNDLYIKPPARVYRKVKPVPPDLYMKSAPTPPQYGLPGPAIGRIPPT